MPIRTQADKYRLSIAGEFYVAAELNRRGIHSAVTYGSAKSADVYAFDPGTSRYVRIEVKTTSATTRQMRDMKRQVKWVVKSSLMDPDTWHEDFLWVLVLIPDLQANGHGVVSVDASMLAPRYFVFTSSEIGEAMSEKDRTWREGYYRRHNKEFDAVGVPTLTLAHVDALGGENRWDKILSRLAAKAGSAAPLTTVGRHSDDEEANAWEIGVAREWGAELNDPREDIYTLEDGEPVDAPR